MLCMWIRQLTRAQNNPSHFGCARDMLPKTTARLAACSLRALLVPTL